MVALLVHTVAVKITYFCIHWNEYVGRYSTENDTPLYAHFQNMKLKNNITTIPYAK
jgi:hypothetical protein